MAPLLAAAAPAALGAWVAAANLMHHDASSPSFVLPRPLAALLDAVLGLRWVGLRGGAGRANWVGSGGGRPGQCGLERAMAAGQVVVSGAHACLCMRCG